MQLLGLAKIQLAEDLSSVRVLEIHEIRAILVKSMDFAAIWLNKFMSGEFHVFHRKMVIFG